MNLLLTTTPTDPDELAEERPLSIPSSAEEGNLNLCDHLATMGSIHESHLSLPEAGKERNLNLNHHVSTTGSTEGSSD